MERVEISSSGVLTVFIHAHLQALLESAGLTLVPVGLVHYAASCAGLASANGRNTESNYVHLQGFDYPILKHPVCACE
jgi:hypothetical protein